MSSEATTNGILTLITDWNQHDYYNGVLKGQLATVCPNLKIIEITNQIPAFNLNNAAFVLKHSYKHFPQGTIHLVMVNNENCKSQRMIAFSHDDHYFIVADNGLIGLLFEETPKAVYEFPFESKTSFSSLESCVKAINTIYTNGGLDNHSVPVANFDQRIPLNATIEKSAITGSIIYIDSYFNAITNVTEELFEKIRQGRKFEIFVQSQHNRVDAISKTYNEVDVGELLVLFNSQGLLEVAVNNGYAAQLLNLSIGSSVRIKFLE